MNKKKITISVGITINTGNFTNVKLDIGEQFEVIGENTDSIYAERIEALKNILREERRKVTNKNG